MHRRWMVLIGVAACSLAAFESGKASAAAEVRGSQDWSAGDWCADRQWGDDREAFCEVRQYTLMPGGVVTVDASPNGGIQVQGGSRGDILVLARVVATAQTETRAQEIASGVQVEATSARISATGPRGLDRGEGWHVSYRVAVPAQTSLALRSTNGGISIAGVEGLINFETTNGGVKLANVAGEVTGRTTNGGVDVDLEGTSWTGAGLDVQTSNGGVRLRVPEQYSARLEVATRNGGMNIDFPMAVQGRLSRELSVDLGAGGPLIRVRTNNGGIRLTKK